MGLVDGITNGIFGSIISAISSIFNGFTGVINSFIGKAIHGPERWEIIKVDDEEKNFEFKGDPVSGYSIYYIGKNNGDRFGRTGGAFLNKWDLRAFDVKGEQSGTIFLIYKLEVQHDWFKNRELATRVARKIYADIMEKIKEPEILKEINYEKWRELYQKK